MLGEIEDLPGERNPAAERYGAYRVKRAGHSCEPLAHHRASDMEPADEQDDDGEALPGRQRVPVSGHEKQDASSQHQRTERQRDDDRPAQPRRTDVLLLEVANPASGGRIDQTGFGPPCEPRRPIGHSVGDSKRDAERGARDSGRDYEFRMRARVR